VGYFSRLKLGNARGGADFVSQREQSSQERICAHLEPLETGRNGS